VSQQRATTLSLLGLAFISTAVKLNLLVAFDDAAEAWVRQHITPFCTALMFRLTQLASPRFVFLLTALLAGMLTLRKSGYWLGRLALSVPGCVLLNEVFKYVFHRTRPAFEHPLVKLQTYSFPSGHAVAATVLYGFVAILLWSYISRRFWRVLIGAVVVALIAGVGLSRVYLGVHYSTDVLAGLLEGVTWLRFIGMITSRHRPA